MSTFQSPSESIAAYWAVDPEAEDLTYVSGGTVVVGVKGKGGPLTQDEVAIVGPAGLESKRMTWEVGAVTLVVASVPIEPVTGARLKDVAGYVWAVLAWSTKETLGVVVAYRLVCVRQT